MTVIGIDVSKGKSTIAAVNNNGELVLGPYDVEHNKQQLQELVARCQKIEDLSAILMEFTGHYHFPILQELLNAGLPVSIANPLLMKKYSDTEIRKAKTDKKDAVRIALFALEKSHLLQPYAETEEKYRELRFLSRQYSQRIAALCVAKEQLLCLLDETMPGITKFLALNSRNPEKSALLLFIKRFESFAKIQRMSSSRFLNAYAKMVARTTDRRAGAKGLAIYEMAKQSIYTRGDDISTVMAQNQLVDLISLSQKSADEIMFRMRNIAELIPEYAVLRSMNGVGDRLGPIILAEIGDVRRFHSGKALNAYAGNDAPPYQSGQFESRNRHISKRGNPALRKACFEVMQALKLNKPQDDPVYQFILKKEQEGKPKNVAKMAGVNKFLRIYYARAMELYEL